MANPSLQLRLTQKLALAPQLQQAIRLLQLNRIELRDYIQELVDENPLLDQEEGADQAGAARSTQSNYRVHGRCTRMQLAFEHSMGISLFDVIMYLVTNFPKSIQRIYSR